MIYALLLSYIFIFFFFFCSGMQRNVEQLQEILNVFVLQFRKYKNFYFNVRFSINLVFIAQILSIYLLQIGKTQFLLLLLPVTLLLTMYANVFLNFLCKLLSILLSYVLFFRFCYSFEVFFSFKNFYVYIVPFDVCRHQLCEYTMAVSIFFFLVK